MENFKEFNGKDLDSVINEACAYFDMPREKLEIEIIQDAKSGIFGIVGARKAKIKARRAHTRETVQSLLGKKQPENAEKPVPAEKLPDAAPQPRQGRRERKSDAPVPAAHPAPQIPVETQVEKMESQEVETGEAEDLILHPVETLDLEELKKTINHVVGRLMEPVAGQKVDVDVYIEEGRVRAHIDWTGDAGLIIGREGQTLEAFEYLASRMVSHIMRTGMRFQLDIGEYRARQEDKLRHTAKILAEKALHTGRSYTTRPLSSYHRRIIHLALQDMSEITTRSSGDGPFKRVVIAPRRSGRS